MPNAADRFAELLVPTFVDLSRFSASMQRRAISILTLLQEDLTGQIRQADVEGVSRDTAKRARTERLIEDVNRTIRTRFDVVQSFVAAELRDLAVLAHREFTAVINDVFTVNITKVTITAQDLRSMANRDVVLGEPAKDWWQGQREGIRRRFAREMRLGVLAGETNEELVRRVRGRSTGRTISLDLPSGRRRVRQFTGGVLDTTTREARALVRTSVQSISNDVLLETYKQNSDLLQGYESITTLDDRTSLICIARTGAAWDLDGNPLPDSTADGPFPGPPPWHFNCRSALVPITKTWEQLVEEARGERRRLLNTVPDSVRASMDGKLSTSDFRSFDAFIRYKGGTFGREVLGAGRYDLWRRGRITTPQLLDQSGRPLSLDELRRRFDRRR